MCGSFEFLEEHCTGFVIGVIVYILSNAHAGPFSLSAAMFVIFRIVAIVVFSGVRCCLIWAFIFIKVLCILPRALCMLDKQSATEI